MENGDQPAYPHTPDDVQTNSPIHGGLTKREYFAAMAMQGMLAAIHGTPDKIAIDIISQQSVTMSDALLAELDKPLTNH